MTEYIPGPTHKPATIRCGPASERVVILQPYLALTSQQFTLPRQIFKANSPSPPTSPMFFAADSPGSPTMSSSTTSSASGSPTMEARHFSQISPPALALPSRRGSTKLPMVEPIPEDEVPALTLQTPQASSQDQLFHANHEIKATLTDLLNCDVARHDPKMRKWIQSRLMDAELELKRQRRRRSSAPTPTSTLMPPPEEPFRKITR
ncbi:hypothetical protein AC579_4411 [Pseudocercospora musae]|uniref:Uncharacterized protein n=1 Tax=Pseudocercospora musae TaxID=113226 RepID=A0A139IJJ2_9PEZI|nr:hypothetical protein AC579_4411 [Pseudocercospora musae]